MGGNPVVILGVSRSGTTLLKEMLDEHSALALPSESYFVPQLWDRHGKRPERAAFLEDVGRLARIREWGVTRAAVDELLPAEPTFADAIGAVYRAYADLRGKPRYGDKTPSYMQRLEVLERAFPGAQYVHLVRDGRNAALSFLAMHRRPRFNMGAAARPALVRRPVAAGARGRAPLRRTARPRAVQGVALRGPRRRSGGEAPRAVRVPRPRLGAGPARVPPRSRRRRARRPSETRRAARRRAGRTGGRS